MNGSLYEQLGGVAALFEQWGACEKTVLTCALARRVPWPGLKLLQRAVEAALQNHIEDDKIEQDANDETLLANLLTLKSNENDDEGSEQLRQLLTLLPLLRFNNERGKDIYMKAMPALVQRCVDAPRQSSLVLDLCRQLLSYLLVHPALTHQDQNTLTQWLRFLENHISGNRNTESVWQQRIESCLMPESNIWAASTFRKTIGKNLEFRGLFDNDPCYLDLLQESFSKNGRDVDLSLDGDKFSFDITISQPKSQRSNSLTPPSTNVIQISSSSENLSDEPLIQKPRSFSLSSEHSLGQIRPISIMYGTTGSETRLDDLKSNNYMEHPGMSTVAQWLKSLRLHKYVWLFTNITYEQMMAIDEKYLEDLGVTKGARHKLLLSIKKLNERASILESVESELASGVTPASAARALEKLKGVLLSPMPPSSDLPVAIVRVLDLASKSINGVNSCHRVPSYAPYEDSDHDIPVDPMSLHCWLVEKALHHESFAHTDLQQTLKRLRHRLPPRQFFHHVSDMPLARRCPKPRWRVSGGAGVGYRRSWNAPPSRLPPAPPPRPPAAAAPAAAAPAPDDYSGLDALCLQMTEQAIN